MFASLPFKSVSPDILKLPVSDKSPMYSSLIMNLLFSPFSILSILIPLITVLFNSFNLLIKVFEVDLV